MGAKNRGESYRESRARAIGKTSKRACPWINAQIIGTAEQGDASLLLQTIALHLPQMNLVNLSTAVHRLAKLTANNVELQAHTRRHPTFDELLSAITEALGRLSASEVQPQSLSNVAWALATMRLVHWRLVQEVASLTAQNVQSFKPFELSTTLWAFAKLGAIDASITGVKTVFVAAAGHVAKNAHHFGFRCLATIVWAFATARQRHARLFRTVAAQMVPMVCAANCQEMANTAWAFGTAGFHDDRLFAELAEQAIHQLDEFKPQELSNILWGFATNGFFHEAFYANASLAAQRMRLQAQHLANILWAFARVRPKDPITQATVLVLLPSCTMQLNTFKPQEVSSTALAVAKAMGPSDDCDSEGPGYDGVSPLPRQVTEFFEAVVPWTIPRVREFSAQSLANTVSAFAKIRLGWDGQLFIVIGREVLGRSQYLEATTLLHLLKGFAAAPQDSFCGQVARALVAAIGPRVRELRPQEANALARLCEALQGKRDHLELPRSCSEELRALARIPDGDAYEMQPQPWPPPAGRYHQWLPHGHQAAIASGYEPEEEFDEQGYCNDSDEEQYPGGTPMNSLGTAEQTWHRQRQEAAPATHLHRISNRPLPQAGGGCENMEEAADPPMQRGRQLAPKAATPPNQTTTGPPSAWSGPDAQGHSSAPLRSICESLGFGLPPPVLPAEIIVPPKAPPQFAAPTFTAPESKSSGDSIEDMQPDVPFFCNTAVGQEGKTTPRAPLPWRCSVKVKNSFLHFSPGDDSEGTNGEDSNDGGSSQRSSSCPRASASSVDLAEEFGSCASSTQEGETQEYTSDQWNKLSPDLHTLRFDWGTGACAPRPPTEARLWPCRNDLPRLGDQESSAPLSYLSWRAGQSNADITIA